MNEKKPEKIKKPKKYIATKARWTYIEPYYYAIKYDGFKNRKFMPLYGIFCITNDNPASIIGYVENEFSMDWAKRVRMYNLKDAKKTLANIRKDYKKHPENKFFIYKLTSRSLKSLISIDFKDRLKKLTELYDKYQFRNLAFTVNVENYKESQKPQNKPNMGESKKERS